jgi:hypothetical protein
MSTKIPSLGEIGWSAHRGYGWTDQFARILRWHELLKNARENDVLDFVFVFFQGCYHLRDWLKFTGSVSKAELDAFFQDSFAMRACRDICNATKHFSLDGTPSLSREFSMAWEYLGDDRSQLVLLTDGRKLSVLSVADDCVATWIRFIREKKIKTELPERIQRLFSEVDEHFPGRENG